VVTYDDLVNVYNVEWHPKFRSGEMSKRDIIEDFLKQWDTVEQDGRVTYEEFEEYYKDVSSAIDKDDYFEAMMKKAWDLDGTPG